MKTFKIIICIIVALLGGSLMEASANNTEVSQSQTTQQSQWIEIGEVTLEHSILILSDSRAYKKAILYVMQLGDKFIYRIRWQSNFYTVNKRDDLESHNAEVVIPDGMHFKGKESCDGKYYLKVPQW